jgi:hypothetical protein
MAYNMKMEAARTSENAIISQILTVITDAFHQILLKNQTKEAGLGGGVYVLASMRETRTTHKTFVDMKNGVFWDVTRCGSPKNRRFGRTYRLHYQGDKNR